MAEPREVEVILTHNGGVEVVEYLPGDRERTLWASDSDDDFKEEFPDFIDEDDLEHVLDFLVEREVLTEDEADQAEVSMESLPEAMAAANGDDEDEGDDTDE